MTNEHDRMLFELLNFSERRNIAKSANREETFQDLRCELADLTRRARALPVSDELIMRKVELDLPGVLSNELAELRRILESKNMKAC